MDIQVIFNLIIHYFLEVNLRNLNVLNCWSLEDRFEFLNAAILEQIFIRIVRQDDNDYQKDIDEMCSYGSGKTEGFVFDYSCGSSSSVLDKLSHSRCFTMTRYWLIYGNADSNLTDIFNDIDLSVDAHITYAKPSKSFSKQSQQFHLYDVYNNGKRLGGKLNITYDKTLQCSAHKDFVMNPRCTKLNLSDFSLRSFYQNRRSMADLTMRLGTVVVGTSLNQSEDVLLEHFNSIKNIHINNIPRYGYRMVVLLRDVFGYNISWHHRNIWSETYTSGGILADLEFELVDQSAAPFILDAPRVEKVWIVFIPGSLRTAFIFRTPEIVDLSGSRFTKPFTVAVWLCIAGLIILFCIGLKYVFTLEQKLNVSTHFLPSYASTMLATFGVMCQQSSYLIPSTSSGRTPYLLLLVACFLIYNYYTSLIVAFLLGSPIKSDIKTLKALADSNLELGLQNVPYIRTYLNYTLPSIVYFQKKLASLKDPNYWVSPEEGILRARKPGYAYHCDVSIGYIFVQKYYDLNEICDINEVDMLSDKRIGMLVKKGSPYSEIFKTKYLWMWETGLVSKHRRYWFRKKPPCLAQNLIESVSASYAAPLFFVLTIGFAGSIFVFLVEICVYYMIRNYRSLRLGK